MRGKSLSRAWRVILIQLGIICLLLSTVWAESSEVVLTKDDSAGILWNSDIDTIRIPFSCEDGIYCVVFDYIPTAEKAEDIMASIRIDGKHPSGEFKTIELPRCWISESENYFDENGDEYAAYLVQRETLMSEPVRDIEGLDCRNLSVELTAGHHELELDYLSGSMMIKKIRLVPVKEPAGYTDYVKKHEAGEYKGTPIVIEGEDVASRSSRDIPCYSHNDSAMSPSGNGKMRINAFGGGYWYKANSSGTWEFEVPEDGLYKISMRVLQNNEGLISQRQVLIDGEVPFAELNDYRFEYGSRFRTEALGGEEPYLFYLTQGKHTITMRAAASMYSEPISSMRETAKLIEQIVSDIQMITGTSPDPNFDYELDVKIPDTMSRLATISVRIEESADMVDELCMGAPAMTSNIHADAGSAEDIAARIRRVPSNLGALTTIQGDLEDAAATLQSHPLAIDWIEIQSPDEPLREPQTSWGSQAKLALVAFANSFRKADNGEKSEDQTIDVWVARDKEWANVLQMLVHEDFESKYGIKANLNVLPSGNTTVVNGASPLLLSVVSGNTPDIALGCDSKTPIELAIRDELYDISSFSDFDDVSAEFGAGAMRALEYEGGCYGLPETTDMPVMVYRADVLEQNEISVPETWEELMQDTLPKLTQIDANFYMGSSSPDMYASMLYQMGGDLYGENGDCMLNTPEAVAAFKQWTRCFVQYNVPQAANFYNEMRTGKLPIGICSLAEYMQLKSYATELTGKMQIAPVPGTRGTDGRIRHDSTGTISSAIMFREAENKDACWQFMKWWMSDEIQTRFALEVESKVGPTGRWMSGNRNSFMNLSWSRQEAGVLRDSIDDYRVLYNVLGGYYSGRAITNAWTRTVFSGMDARDSIEQCYEEIAKQIDRKRREYAE